MSSSRETGRLDPLKKNPSAFSNSDQDGRLEDYLNDKFQTTADFGNLSSLIANVETHKLQLEAQLRDARRKLEEARQASTNHASCVQRQTQEFEKQHNEVQKRLMVVTASDSPEDAVRRLKPPMEKLRKVELATAYVELLKDVDRMVQDARGRLPGDPKEALKPYTQMRNLAISLRTLQEPAEGAGVHIVEYLDSVSTRLWAEMRKIMRDEFEAVLKKLEWPKVAMEPSTEWRECFEKLLDLQAPEILAAREPLVLLPMSVLTRDFVLQFKYHFMSPKPTNSTEHLGDYFFEWFIGTVAKWEPYFRDNVGPILAGHFRDSPLISNSLYVDPVAALITALLPVLMEKVDSLLKEVHKQPNLFSKFMSQLMNFDERIRNEFNYDGGNLELDWKGLTWEVLDKWFDNWIQIEKTFAFDRLHEIMDAPDNALIDYDSRETGKTKPPRAAIMVTDLFRSVTSQYGKLRRLSLKMRFLLRLQFKILDRYHGRLIDALEKYHALTSVVGRTVHGYTKEEQLAMEGIGGLETLCKIFGGADCIIHMLQDLSNDEFFISLWDELQSKAKERSPDGYIAGTLTFEEVKDSTAKTLGSDDDGSVFDETISSFTRTRTSAEEYLIQAIKYSFPSEFRTYIHRAQWTTVGGDSLDDPSLLSTTPELDQPLYLLKQKLGFLRRTVSYPIFLRIWRLSLESLQDLLWKDVLLKQDFTTLGSIRFKQDINAIQIVVDSFLKGGSVKLGMPRSREGIELLSLPIEAQEGGISLKEADELVYSGVQQAMDVLSRLELNYLTPADARAILQRRVEAAN